MDTETLSKRQIRRKHLKFDIKYFLSTRLGGYPAELNSRLKSYWGSPHWPEKKFLIFSSGRSGSTLLVELLNNHPLLYCDDEILKRKLFQPGALIEARAKLSDAAIYGFKLLSYQLRDIQTGILDKPGFLAKLVDKDYKIIYLRRENKFFQALSLIRAISRSKWHTTGKPRLNNHQLELDVKKLDELLNNLYRLDEFEKELMHNLPHLKITYEEDLLNNQHHQITVNKVSEYLNIKPVGSKCKLKKITSKVPRELISNREEVSRFLENSEYHFLSGWSEYSEESSVGTDRQTNCNF